MTGPTDGTSPTPPEFSAGAALFGTRTDGRPNRRAWRIELTGLSPIEGAATEVRVTMVDAETGKRVAAQRVPFEWIRDVAFCSTATMTLHEGDWS